MARQVEFDRFLIIESTPSEVRSATGGYGICDTCCDTPLKGCYVAVLNRWLCPECFEKWKTYAKWYPEDADIENRNFDFYAQRFGIKCQ